ncbi:MAG: LCP family protein, partial [Clostridiales bacterium]|nr:LCP family protein [Clostridiales bacterium]
KLSSGGTYTLNGRQALSYARIRYVGDGDFERTERQRKVLMKVLEKLKSSNVKQLDNFLNTLLPQVTTNCTKTELVELVLNSAAYFNYDIKQNRVPYDNTWKFLTIRKMSVLSIDFDKNIKYIHDNIYK